MKKFPDQIFRKDWTDERVLQRGSYTYDRVYDDDRYIVWSQRDFHKGMLNLEVWRKLWATNPDGKKVLVPPTDSNWGLYGWTLVGLEDQMKSKLSKTFGIAPVCLYPRP